LIRLEKEKTSDIDYQPDMKLDVQEKRSTFWTIFSHVIDKVNNRRIFLFYYLVNHLPLSVQLSPMISRQTGSHFTVQAGVGDDMFSMFFDLRF
jgi:hypothetical protein